MMTPFCKQTISAQSLCLKMKVKKRYVNREKKNLIGIHFQALICPDDLQNRPVKLVC